MRTCVALRDTEKYSVYEKLSDCPRHGVPAPVPLRSSYKYSGKPLPSFHGKRNKVFVDINEKYTRDIVLEVSEHARRLLSPFQMLSVTLLQVQRIAKRPTNQPTNYCCRCRHRHRRRRRRRRRQVFASKGGGAYEVVEGAGEGGEAVSPPSDEFFQFSEYERVDWKKVLSGDLMTSNFCVRKGMSRKAQLWLYTRLHAAKSTRSSLKDGIPESCIIQTWNAFEEDGGGGEITMGDGTRADFGSDSGLLNMSLEDKVRMCCGEFLQMADQAETRGEEPTWILKPSATNRGAGITVFICFEQLLEALTATRDVREWVVSRYVERPLLLNKRKFHIRAYVLAAGAIDVYFYDEVLCLCAGTKYSNSSNGNFDPFAHITNTCYQSEDPNFNEEDCVMLLGDMANALAHTGRFSSLEEAKHSVDGVLDDMRDLTAELFKCFKGEFGVYAPLPGCWEHYGLDFLVEDLEDGRLKVYLLEVNPGPDFKQTGGRLDGVVRGVMEETIGEQGGTKANGRGRFPLVCLNFFY